MSKMRSFEKRAIPPRILHNPRQKNNNNNNKKRNNNKNNNNKRGPLRVFICGPHGVGKTTLVEALANQNQKIAKREEIARKYFMEKGETAEDVDPKMYPKKFEYFQKYIMDLQCQIEEDDELIKGVVIYDRGPDALVYVGKYHPEGDRIRMEMLAQENVKRALRRYRNSLVILLRPDKTFSTKDNVRMDSSFEELMDLFEHFKQTFRKLAIPFKIISTSSLKRRISLILNYVAQFKRKQ